MPAAYLFIHTLVDPQDAWGGYLVETSPDTTESIPAMAYLFDHPTLSTIDSRHLWFAPMLVGESDTYAPPKKIIPLMTNAVAASGEAIKTLEASLRREVRKLAREASTTAKLPATGEWDYLFIPAVHARSLPPYSLIGLSSRSCIVATQVNSPTDTIWLRDNGCQLNTTEYLLARNSSSKKADLTRVKLLKLLGLISNDAETGEIEAVFREEPKLAYSLLRLVNSAANAPRSPITSFSQAIAILGRRQLQRWLQLLVYADPNNGQHPNPLLQKAAARGYLLEWMSRQVDLGDCAAEQPGDLAFMVGTFSLLDLLLNISMPEILQQLPLPPVVSLALAEQKGPLGRLLAAIRAGEERRYAEARNILGELGITPFQHIEAQLEALAWAGHIHPTEQ